MLGPCSIRHYLSTGSFPSACEHAYGDSNLTKQNQRPALIPVLLQATTKSFLLQNILTIFYLNLLQALSSFLLYSSSPSLPPPPSPPTHTLPDPLAPDIFHHNPTGASIPKNHSWVNHFNTGFIQLDLFTASNTTDACFSHFYSA